MDFPSTNLEQQEDLRRVLLAECEQCRIHSEQRPRNDKLIAHWGAMLLQLAVITDELKAKHELLKDSREKLQRAIDINPSCTTPDGQLCLFQLANAFYLTYIFESDDAQAEKYLQKCSQLAQKGRKKDPKNTTILKQIKEAPQQRAECLSAAKRFEGKTKEEQQVELVKMGKEKCDAYEEQLQASPKDASLLKQYGSQLLELSILTEREDVEGARARVIKAMQLLQQSSELERDQQCFTVLSLATNAVAMVEEDAAEAHKLLRLGRQAFSQAVAMEESAEQLARMLMQLRDMYATNYTWREQHPNDALKMPIDVVPPELAALPPSENTPPQLVASSPPPKAAEPEASPKKSKKGARGGEGSLAAAKRAGEGKAGSPQAINGPKEAKGSREESEADGGREVEGPASPPANGGEGEGEGEGKKKKKKNRRRKKAAGGEEEGGAGGLFWGLGWGGAGLLALCAAAAVVGVVRLRGAARATRT